MNETVNGPLLPVALEWLAAGGAPVPIGMAEKHPCVRWKQYHEQGRLPSEDEVRIWFGNGSRAGLGLLAGHGGLEMLELEARAVAEGVLDELTAELGARGLAPLWERIAKGYSEESPSGGYHVILRVTGGAVLGNTQLARRPESAAELDAREMTAVEARKGAKKPRPVVLIETRGIGGFTVLAPTVKGNGKAWALLSGGPRAVAEVSVAERDELYASRMCDTYAAWKAEQQPVAAVRQHAADDHETGQAEVVSAELGFAAYAPWADILEPAGWVHAGDDDQGHQLWRRPGKADGLSATTSEDGGLWVFSSSTEFDTEVPYSKDAAYAVLHEDIDPAEALKRYGTAQQAHQAARDFTLPGSGRSASEVAAEQVAERAARIAADGHSVSIVTADGVQDMSPSPDRPLLDDDAADRWARDQKAGQFFTDTGGLLSVRLGAAVSAMGPLGRGLDNRVWRYTHGVWVPAPDEVSNRLVKLTKDAYRASHVKTIENVVSAFVPLIDSEPVSQYINVPNGLLDWRTGELCGHTPDVLSTVQMAVPWDPDATCPLFDWWLAQVLPADCVELAWELIGYQCYSGNPLHIAVMLVGNGRNGKGTYLRVGTAIIGKANTTAVSLADLVGNRFRAAKLFGKTANIAGDIDATYLENTALFKNITGMDQITAEHKNKDPFDFTAWAVPVFSANKVPAASDTSAGYLSRWLVLPFPVSFEGREDRTIEPRLMAELPGIMAAGLRRLPGLLDRGQFNLAGSPSAREAKADFARRVDQVRYWLHECCQTWTPVRGEPGVSRTVLYEAYKRWVANDSSGKSRPLKSGEFYDRLEAAGVPYSRDNAGRWFYGIRVTDPCQLSPMDYLR
jgi:putative DNA primase/helicase